MTQKYNPSCSLLDLLPFCTLGGSSDSDDEQVPVAKDSSSEQRNWTPAMQQKLESFRQRLRVGTKAESTEWLSAVVQTMWPAAEEYAPEIFKGFIEPAINANMPGIFPTISFSQVELGRVPPEIKTIRVLPTNPDRPDLIYLEADFEYNGDMAIAMGLEGLAEVGASNIKCSGKLEILVGPRVAKIPFFDAFQVGFLSPPEVDFKLTGLAKGFNLEVFKSTIKNVSMMMVNEMFALPNRLCFPVFPKIDYMNCAADHIGVVRIKVLSGKGFPKSDAFNTPPDVYIRLRHCGEHKDTRHIKDSTSPEYDDEVVDFAIASTSNTQQIYFQAFDKDLAKADDELGTGKLSLVDITKKVDHTVKLQDNNYRKRPQLSIKAKKLKLSYGQSDITEAIELMRKEKNNRKNCSRLLLKININEIEHLPPCQGPFIKIKVSGTSLKFETGSAFHGKLGDVETDPSNPVYMMSFTAFIEEPISEQETIEFSVQDRMTGRKIGTGIAYITDQESREFKIDCSKSDDAILKANIRLAAVIDDDPFWNH